MQQLRLTFPGIQEAKLARETDKEQPHISSFGADGQELAQPVATSKNEGRPRRRRNNLMLYLSILGPGLIAANAGNDAGGVFTYSVMGAQYGFSMLWVMVVVGIGVAVVQEMCARMGAATGKGLSDLIRENFGIRWTALVMLALLIANGALVISEFVGIAAASELFGIPAWISAPVAGIGLWLLIVRGSYDRVEKVFIFFTLAFFTYIIAAFMGNPPWEQVLYHTFVPTVRFEGDYLQTLIAAIGTTISPYMQLFIQSSVVEKGTTMRDYKYEKIGVYSGSAFSILVAYFIIVATAATLFKASNGAGFPLESAKQAAVSLEPLLGRAAEYTFAAGLLGASLLAAGVLPLATSYSITEALGFENGVNRKFGEAPVFWSLFTGLIVISVLVAAIPGLPVVQILINIYVLNGIILPFILFAVLLLVNNKELMGRYTNGLVYNIIAWSIAVVVSLLSLFLVVNSLLGLFGLNLLGS